MASFCPRLSLPRRVLDTTGAVGALRRVIRFRHGTDAGMAHDDFPALLRCGRDFLGNGDGFHDHHSPEKVFWAEALCDDQPPRCGGQARAVHLAGGWLRVHERMVCGVVQWQRSRAKLFRESYLGTVVVGVGHSLYVQHGAAAFAIRAATAAQRGVAGPHLIHDLYWYVVRGARDCGYLAVARIRAL